MNGVFLIDAPLRHKRGWDAWRKGRVALGMTNVHFCVCVILLEYAEEYRCTAMSHALVHHFVIHWSYRNCETPPPPPPQALPSSSSSFIPPPKPPVSCVEVCFLPYLYWENSFLRLVPSFGAVNNLLYFHSDAVGIYSKEDFRKDSYITDLAEHYCSTFPHRSPFTLLCTFLTWPCTPLPETS